MEQKITLSSIIAKGKTNRNKPEDFETVLDRPIILDKNKTYVAGLDRIDTMTYSWYNISPQYDNNYFQYSIAGQTPRNRKLNFPPGSYSYEDINSYARSQITNCPFKMEFDRTRFKVLITLDKGTKIIFTEGKFNELLGFLPNQTIATTSYSDILPNITNSVDTIYIHCDLISNSIVDGSYSDIIYTFSTAHLIRSYPFEKKQYDIGYCEVNKSVIDSIRIYITDAYNRLIDLNGIDVSLTLILKEKNI